LSRDVLSGCEGKAKMTRQHAKVAAKRGRRKHQALEAYRCRSCGNWHVGHSKGKRENPESWTPRPDRERDRPTPERKARGQWVWVDTSKAGQRAARDMWAHPVDRLEYSQQIDNDQASAARDYEQLYRAAIQVGGIRDSTTLWEPKGHENDDGNVEGVKRYRQFCRAVGTVRERQLQWVCIEGKMPRSKPDEIGQFREVLNEAARFFGYGRRAK